MENKTLNPKPRILVVDDEEGARESLELILEDEYDVVCMADGFSALEHLKKEMFHLVLLDLSMPEIDGIETLKRIKSHDKLIDVIMVSATDRAREAVAAINTGAYDYITKPIDEQTLLAAVERALQKRSLEQEVRYLRSEVANKSKETRFVSRSKGMKDIFVMIDKVAKTASSVLITGESGTGKELIARSIHSNSPRSKKPFVGINCASIPSELMESELFGYEKGAFTGAHNRSIGKFEFADGGTIFLDEISTLKPELQAKLLRFLQEREFTKVGSNQIIKVDVRVVAATNTSIPDMIKEKRFRDDLFFRLNVIPIEVPPLRQRKDDIPVLVDYFLEKFNTQLNKRIKGITPQVMDALKAYAWPGNVRELENLIERIAVLGSDDQMIYEKDIPYSILLEGEYNQASGAMDAGDNGLSLARDAFERQYILAALQNSRWNQTETARMLKVHRNTLIKKMRDLKLKRQN